MSYHPPRGRLRAAPLRAERVRALAPSVGSGAAALVAVLVAASPAYALDPARVAEQISPVAKRAGVGTATSGNVGNATPGWSNVAGDAFMYLPAGGAITEDTNHGGPAPITARRGTSGWENRSTAPDPLPDAPYTGVYGNPFQIIPSTDLTRVLFTSAVAHTRDQPVITAPGTNGAVLVGTQDQVFWASRPTWPDAFPAPGTFGDRPAFLPVGGSDDLRTAVFDSGPTLVEADGAARGTSGVAHALYRWTDGVLAPAGVLPDGTLDPGGSVSAGTLNTGGQSDGTGNRRGMSNPVARDGRSILFVSPDPMSDEAVMRAPQLYRSIDGAPAKLLTARPDGTPGDGARQIAVGWTSLRSSDTPALRAGVFSVATPDHRFVVFATGDALVPEAGGAGAPDRKVYRLDTATGALRYLPELSLGGLEDEGVVIRISDDGSRILFRDGDALRLWRDDAQPLTIGSSASGDAVVIANARFAAGGRTVVFNSQYPLGGESLHPDGLQAIYRYVEGTGALTCVSCGTVEHPQTADAFVGYEINSTMRSFQETRAVTSDGRTVVFDTTSALTPDDRNDVLDVYQWRDGRLTLLSGGEPDALYSQLVDISASGDDVFISTADRLAKTDVDDQYDIYDLRVGGGFPVAPPRRPCDGDACQGRRSTPPATPAPGSTADGPGNVRPVAPPAAPPAAAPSRLTVGRASGSATGVRLTATVSGAGRLEVRGTHLRTVSRGGKLTLRATLTPRARAALRRRGSLQVRATVRFVPRSGVARTRTATVTISRAKRGS